jgi:hypothetical protein
MVEKVFEKKFKGLGNVSRYVLFIYVFIQFIYLFFAPALNSATRAQN